MQMAKKTTRTVLLGLVLIGCAAAPQPADRPQIDADQPYLESMHFTGKSDGITTKEKRGHLFMQRFDVLYVINDFMSYQDLTKS